MRFTDLSVRHLPLPEHGQKAYFDDGLRNFGIRVSYGGTRTWIVVVGPEKKRRWLKIGRYPEMSLKEARDAAKQVLAKPPPPKQSPLSFEHAIEQFLADNAERLADRTLRDYRNFIFRNFTFGSTRLANVRTEQIQTVIRNLKDKPAERYHAFSAIRAFFNWAHHTGLIEDSPVARIKAPPPVKSKERVLSDDELAQVYRTSITFPFPYGPLTRLLILTGQRRSQLASLKWDWINFDENIITFPPEVVKNRTTQVLPLTPHSSSVIEAVPRTAPLLFPTHKRTGDISPFANWSSAKVAFDKELRDVAPYTLHDLRRTFSTRLAKLGTPIHVTEKLLHHISGTISGVAAIYNRHSYLDEQRQALEGFERHLDTLIEA